MMIRSFALGRLAYVVLAIAIFLLIGTVWFTGGVSYRHSSKVGAV